MSEQEEPFVTAMRAKGHTPILEDGRVNSFVVDSGFHNGPGCSVCHESWCEHCTHPDRIEPCIGAEAAAARDAKDAREREDRILAEAEEIRTRRAASNSIPST